MTENQELLQTLQEDHDSLTELFEENEREREGLNPFTLDGVETFPGPRRRYGSRGGEQYPSPPPDPPQRSWHREGSYYP